MLKQGTILWHYGSNTVNASLCEERKKIIQVVFFQRQLKDAWSHSEEYIFTSLS